MREILIITDRDVRDYADEAVLVINARAGEFALKGDIFTDLSEIPSYYCMLMHTLTPY